MSEVQFYDTDFLVDTLTAMTISTYCAGSMGLNWNQSKAEHEIIKELAKRGITPSVIDNRIAESDFTNMLTHYGSGDRERGFAMDYIKEVFDEYTEDTDE